MGAVEHPDHPVHEIVRARDVIVRDRHVGSLFCIRLRKLIKSRVGDKVSTEGVRALAWKELLEDLALYSHFGVSLL